MEKKLNLILVFNVVLLFVLITIMSCTLLSKIQKQSKGKWYIYPEKDIDAGFYAATSVGSFFILLNQLVPLALLINIEIAKISYGFYMEYDAEFMSPVTGVKLSV